MARRAALQVVLLVIVVAIGGCRDTDLDRPPGVSRRSALAFRIVAEESLIAAEAQRKQREGAGYKVKEGFQWVPVKDRARGEFAGKPEALLQVPASEEDDWTGDKLGRVGTDYDNLQQVVTFSVKDDLKALFGSFTSRNVGKRLAIVYDGAVVSAPAIKGRIEGHGIIAGLSPQEVERLVKLFESDR